MHTTRFTFQGIEISAINQQKAIELIQQYEFDKPGYVCFPDSYTVFSAAKDSRLLEILNHAVFTMPDGKPLEFYARRKGLKDVKTVSGFWTAKTLLNNTNLTHYFYGSSLEVLEKLETVLKTDFPEAKILGYKSPPFVNLDNIENDSQINADITEIALLNPDIIWVGISSPKQDYLMAHYIYKLNRGLMLGVGGVFEYLSGDVQKSPEWIKKIGFRWLFRLLKEPRRLWRKYLFVILSFIRIIFQGCKTK